MTQKIVKCTILKSSTR